MLYKYKNSANNDEEGANCAEIDDILASNRQLAAELHFDLRQQARPTLAAFRACARICIICERVLAYTPG